MSENKSVSLYLVAETLLPNNFFYINFQAKEEGYCQTFIDIRTKRHST